MSLLLSSVITASRDRSPWFHKSRVTDAVLARHLSDVQNELIAAAVRRDPQFLAQAANVVLNLDGSDAPGTVGAGTSGGLPSDGTGLATAQGTAGALVEARTTTAEGASVFVAERVATSATANALTSTGAGRSVNADAQRVLVITGGKGLGQRRTIISNTADTWTISTGSDGQQWTTIPDSTSLLRVVVPVYGVDDGIGVITNAPAVSTTVGYLVKLHANGTPYIDFTAPLVATMDAGVPLPSMQFPLDGTCWYTDGSSAPLYITSAERRFTPAQFPAIYVLGQTLYLVGQTTDWQGIASISLRYAPVAPVFTALTDTFLLPDHARPALVAKAAAFMAMRVNGMPEVNIDPITLKGEAVVSEKAFLNSVSAGKRGRRLQTRDVY